MARRVLFIGTLAIATVALVAGAILLSTQPASVRAADASEGSLAWIDVGATQTAEVHVVPAADGRTGTVFFYEAGAVNAAEYDTQSRTLSTPVQISSPSHRYSGRFFADRDSSGNIWATFSDALVRFSPRERQSAEWVLPKSRKPVPVSLLPGTTAVNAAIMQAEVPEGLAVDASGTVWVSRQQAGDLLRFNPETQQFDVEALPPSFQTGGPLAVVQGKGLFLAEGILSESRTTGTSGPRAALRPTDSNSWTPIDATLHEFVGRDPNGKAVLRTGKGIATCDSTGKLTTSELSSIGRVVALGPNGDVWSIRDGALYLQNASTGESKRFTLPTVTGPHGAPAPPFFRSAVVDAVGNLWFAYVAGFNHAGVALRE